MSSLAVYHQSTPDIPNKVLTHLEDIAATLAEHGVLFERWQANAPIPSGASQEEVIGAYRQDVDRLMTARGYLGVDVERVNHQEPQALELREQVLSEDLVRFFAAGRGLITLHINDYFYAVICEKHDLIAVPAGVRHWLDMGETPRFVTIRLFNTHPDRVETTLTGEKIAETFTRLDD